MIIYVELYIIYILYQYTNTCQIRCCTSIKRYNWSDPFFDVIKLESEKIELYLRAMAHSLNESVISCWFKGAIFPCDSIFEQVQTDTGKPKCKLILLSADFSKQRLIHLLPLQLLPFCLGNYHFYKIAVAPDILYIILPFHGSHQVLDKNHYLFNKIIERTAKRKLP